LPTIELVLREGNAPGFGSADMVMMTLTGGAERTAREFESLLARAGLKMTRVVPTTTSASIVEALGVLARPIVDRARQPEELEKFLTKKSQPGEHAV